jgi:3-methyladenine DNA glycosylase AlkD
MNKIRAKDLEKVLKGHRNKEKAKKLATYFKTAKSEYAEGDIFWGISVLEQRKIVENFKDLPLINLQELLNSEIHEKRFSALLILVDKYKKGGLEDKKKIVHFYLKNVKNINNWDLVDVSAHYILGDYLWDKDRGVIYELAKSDLLWSRRIAVVSTFSFIKKDDFQDILKLSVMLLNDPHHLIHKSLGWMLRELGKRDRGVLEEFLSKYKNRMPRVMLRYAIEKFPESRRKNFLKK